MRKDRREDRSIKEQLQGLQLGFAISDTFSCGQIHYTRKKKGTEGSEQAGERPVIIVSADWLNRISETVEVVPLTTRDKHPLPTHVPIGSALEPSTALCEQIQTVEKKTMYRHIGGVSAEEMGQIRQALAVSLGFDDIGLIKDGDIPEGTARRGEIYALGSSRKETGRMVLVVSNDVGNRFSTIVEAVRLAKGERESSPAHVPIRISDITFTALCGEIQTMDRSRIGKRVGTMTAKGMAKVDHALAAGLGLPAGGGAADCSSAAGKETGSKVPA